MKKVISVFLALMMCLSLAIPAFAVDTTGDISYNKPGETIDWGPKEPDMCLTLPTEIVVYDDRSGNYTVGATEVRNAGKAAATITDVQVSPSQGWSLSDWDAARGNVPVDAKTFSMRVFDAAVGSTGHVADTTAFPSLPKDASADMGVSFWMAPQRNIDGRPQVADVVVTAEFEDISVHAILYSDGELVFQQGSTPEEGRTVAATYANVEKMTGRPPWTLNPSSIKTVTFSCNVVPISTASWFGQCSNLATINNIEKLDTSMVTNMSNMFYLCTKLTSLDVSGFDTSSVTDMSQMFSCCIGFTSLDVTGFDTSNVTNMSSMFYNCRNLTSLDVSGFNAGSVTNMSSMFSGCSSLTSLDMTSFNTSNVTDMSNMFSYCSGLTSLDMTGLDTSNVTTMSYMFYSCKGLTSLDVTGFDTSSVTNISVMFSDCSSLTSLDVTGFDTSSVTNMSSMFSGCSSLTSLDVTGFDTGNVTGMSYMFDGCSNMTTIYAANSFITTDVTSSSGMFSSCSKLIGGNGTKYTSSHQNKEYARIDTDDTPGYFTAKPISVTVEDHTNAAATVTEPSNGWRLGANTFSVSSEKVCAVGLLRDGVCTELGYSSESGADHVFKADLQEGDAIVVVLRGDADLNGRINPDDSSCIRRYLNGSYNAGYANILAMDLNCDGNVDDIDGSNALSACIGSYTMSWKSAVLEVPEMAAVTMDAAMLDGMAAPGMDAVPEFPSGDGTYEVDPDTEVVEVPETPIFDVEPETPEVPTEPSEPEEPAGDQVEEPDEGATEPEPGEEPAEKPDDVPASPDVEPSQDPEPAAKPDEEDPAPDAGNQDGDGEGVPDTETPEDAQPPVDDGEAASNVPEEPGQD